MKGSIYVIAESGDLVELTERSYDSETLLQKLLSDHPRLLAGDQINPEDPRRWILIKREKSVPAGDVASGTWYIDHLFLDQAGIPTLVEVKRTANRELRRRVVGQLLDYAANAVVHWPVEEIRARFRQTCEERGVNPQECLEDLLESELEPGDFWQMVKTNLQAGRVRLLFVADAIPTRLRRVVEFLNEQMDPAEVLAVEVPQFAADDLTAMAPRVVGQSMEAVDRKSAAVDQARRWDEQSFVAEFRQRHGQEPTHKLVSLLDWVHEGPLQIQWGAGETYGGFTALYGDHKIFYVKIDGKIAFYFQYYKQPFEGEERRREFLQRLNEVPDISFPQDAIGGKPSVKLAALREESLDRILDCVRWYLAKVDAFSKA